MINAIGLANPGVHEVRRSELPWLAANLRRARVLVNVAWWTMAAPGTVIVALLIGPSVAGGFRAVDTAFATARSVEPDAVSVAVSLALWLTSVTRPQKVVSG